MLMKNGQENQVKRNEKNDGGKKALGNSGENEGSKPKLLAVVRVRGVTGISPKIRFTLKLLGVEKSNYAAIIRPTAAYMGMIKKAKDYITWGPVSVETLSALLEKRGETEDGKKLRELKKPEEIKSIAFEIANGSLIKSFGICKTFRLTPPSGGYKNKKKNYPYGDLGPRPSMDQLIKAMI
jgi:large subunit ribosomal protein L30